MHTRNSIIKSASTVFLFISLTQILHAGNPGMTEEQMEQLMKNAEKMQACMAKMDQSAMQKLSDKGKKMQGELKSLCAAGKRDEAQSKAIKFGQEIATSKEMQEMKKCGEMAQQMMKQMPAASPGSRHVCDGF